VNIEKGDHFVTGKRWGILHYFPLRNLREMALKRPPAKFGLGLNLYQK
jgi:hypothetical protein